MRTDLRFGDSLRASFLALALASLGLSQSTVAVVNGASFQRQAPVAPGSIASAFGTFTGVAETAAAAVPLPRELGGIRVLVGTVEAPLFYVSPSQINFQVPALTAPGRVTMRVTRGGQDVVAGSFTVFDSGPGLFVAGSNPAAVNPVGAVLNQNNAPNTAANPARRGETIQIFGTGPGPVSATVEDGRPAPATPLTTTTTAPRVYVSVLDATVQYSGLSGQFVGLWQVNAVVPDRPFIAGQVPLVIVHNGLETNTVTVYVAP